MAGEVDVAAVWGPVAGCFAAKEKPPLVVTAIAGNPEARLPMTFDIAIGVRRADKALKVEVDSALSSLAPKIRTILASYSIPVVWRPRSQAPPRPRRQPNPLRRLRGRPPGRNRGPDR